MTSSKTAIRSSLAVALGLIASLLAGSSVATPPTVINVEIDYMVLRDGAGNVVHSHMPNPDEIAAVVQMFACHDIIANLVVDQEVPEVPVLIRNPSIPFNFWDYTGPGGYGAISQTYFNHAGQSGWHYCVFGHQYQLDQPTTSSGIAQKPGQYLLVTLGAFSGSVGTPFDRAATLAHELGHNLGLSHCGNIADDCTGTVGDDPPNVASIMSYAFQLSGVRSTLESNGLAPRLLNLFKDLDYSSGSMCRLNEYFLDEVVGTRMMPVDWDCNGTVGGVVAHDLSGLPGGWCQSAGGLDILWDYDEWANIQDETFDLASLAMLRPKTVSCITHEEWTALQQRRKEARVPRLVSEPCQTGAMTYLRAGGTGNGKCDSPFGTVRSAVAAVPAGSILYVAPGIYVEPGGALVIDRPVVVACPGLAVIHP